jgi:hypothetical protein
MPSGGADAPYGGAGRVDAGPRDAGGSGADAPSGPERDVTDVFRPTEAAHAVPQRPLGAALRDGLRGTLRAEARVVVLLLAGALVLAAAWRLLAPEVAGEGNQLEAAAAVDGTLALLGVVAGVVTAAAVLLWPGELPARRTVVVLVGTVLAGVLTWKVGDQLGTPALRAKGVVLVWPIIAAAGLFTGSLLPGLSRRLES